MPRRNVTSEPLDPRERYVLYRLCDCPTCEGSGKGYESSDYVTAFGEATVRQARCPDCRGEGRIRQELASCETPEAVGVALVTLAREGEFEDCPLGLLDRMPECEDCSGLGRLPSWGTEQLRQPCHKCAGSGIKPTGTWLILPWLPSARNVSDAGRQLARSKKRSS